MLSRVKCGVSLAIVLFAARVHADDAINSKINSQTASIETVKSMWGSSSYDVRLLIAPGLGEQSTVLAVSTHASDEWSPRIEIGPEGDTWITWWRDLATDEVRVRRFSNASQSFDADRRVSQATENARNPEIVHDGTNPWITYEVHGVATSIVVAIIGDDPDPVPTGTVLRTTSFTGNVDAEVHFQSGHLWVTWIEGSSELGWSEYDYVSESWSSPSYQSYSGTGVGPAKQTIQDLIVRG